MPTVAWFLGGSGSYGILSLVTSTSTTSATERIQNPCDVVSQFASDTRSDAVERYDIIKIDCFPLLTFGVLEALLNMFL